MKSSTVFTVLVGTAMACGLAIALVFEATAARIASNRAALLEEAVSRVLPGATRLAGYRLGDDALAAVAAAEADAIAGYDDGGRLIGVALPAGVMGYQDRIDMLLGYDPQRQRLTGFAVLQSRETPGLGSKIGTDPAFLASLGSLDVGLDGTALARPVTLAARGAARRAHQVDGITGATVSSKAVVRAVNLAAPQFAALRARLTALAQGAPEAGHGR